MMQRRFLTFIFFTLSLSLAAQKNREQYISVHSSKMDREIDNIVFLPQNYFTDSLTSYPVVYLLNGFGGNHTSWKGIKPNLGDEASKYKMIIVCPDGQNSWYWDSPIDAKMQFETYISQELVNYLDRNYRTIKSAKHRAVAGLSMGGHGGLWLGINHPTVFGACGSMSGGVDIRPFSNGWQMKERLGKMSANYERWSNYTIINQLYKIEPNSLDIIIDCGYDDFFFQVNEKLHEEMRYMNIKHDYITRPGGHNKEYWNNAIDYQLLFFHKVFESNIPSY